MTSIEQSLYTVIGLIILIGMVYLFFSVFGSTECDKLSNTTAIELTNAISQVALEDKVQPWTENSVPPDEKTDYYTTAEIRLCEKNRMNTFSALFSAQSPTYILTYETFPEAGYAWSESQPFSGGAAESLINYGVMKYGLKFATYVGKYATKLVKALWNGGLSLVKLKLYRWFEASRLKRLFDNNKHLRAVKNFFKRLIGSQTQTTLQDRIEDKLNKKLYPDELKGLVDKVKYYIKNEFLSEEEALIKAGVIKGVEDKTGKTVKWVPNFLYDLNTGNKQYIVKQEYRKFMQLFIENTGEASEMYKGLYHIPSRLGSAFEKFKIEKWYPFKYSVKNWWRNTWFKRTINSIKGFYDERIKGTWNDFFNHNEVEGIYDTSQDIGAMKNYMMMNRDKITEEVKGNVNFYKGPIEEIWSEEGVTRIISKADDITDEDVIKLVNNYDRYFNANALMLYFPREQDELAEVGAHFFGKEYFDRAEKIRDAWTSGDLATAQNAWKEFHSLSIPFKNLNPTEQQDLIDKISAGYIKRGTTVGLKIDSQVAEDLYEYARVSAIKNNIFQTAPIDIKGLNLLVSQADEVKAGMKVAPFYLSKKLYKVEDLRLKITDRFLTPVITHQSFSKLKTAMTYGWYRFKRGVFIDANRVGQGIGPITIAPYNWLSSPYSIKQALQQASEIQEGGCSHNAICRIVRMGVTGPTETATSYLLDRRVPEGIEVKTWRPKPSILERTPIGLNTIPFYLSVPENPRFHVVGPCFGIAKVWKNGDTVYVSIGKENKCNVNCSQPGIPLSTPSSIGIPFTDWNINLPSYYLGTFGVSNADTPNYCYADEEYIWGENLGKGGDQPYAEVYLPGYVGCVLICSAATHGTGTKVCLKSCGYATIGALTANVVYATQAYRDVPSWKRQETGWGYWNYQKAMDICDTIDFISSFGSFNMPTQQVQALPGVGFKEVIPVQTGGLQKVLSTSGQKIQKISKYTTMGVGDICTAIQLIGDTSLAWPIKTPQPDVWKKAAILDDECMRESASECAWLRRCDPITAPCEEGFYCDVDAGTCKKQGSWVT